MNTHALTVAYDDLLEVAGRLDYGTLGNETRAAVDWLVAHLVLSDPILIAAGQQVLDGTSPTVDNHPAVERPAIHTLTAEFMYDQRVEAIRDNARRLIEVHGAISNEAGDTHVTLVLYDRNANLAHQGTTTWAELIDQRASLHLPGHTRTFGDLVHRRG